MESWLQYEKTEHWKALSAEKLRQQSHRCENCRGTDKMAVHHNCYRSFYDCTLDDLMALCGRCHLVLHAYINHRNIKIDLTTAQALELLRRGRAAPYPAKPLSHVAHLALRHLARLTDEEKCLITFCSEPITT